MRNRIAIDDVPGACFKVDQPRPGVPIDSQPSGLDGHEDGLSLVGRQTEPAFHEHRLQRIPAGRKAEIDVAGTVRTVHDAESGEETVPFGDLVRHHRADFGGQVGGEDGFPEAHSVRRRGGEYEHAPSGQVVRQLEFELAAAAAVQFQRRIPVRDMVEERPHAQVAAAVSAGIGALQLDALPADETRQQAVISDIQAIEIVETRVRIEILGAALNEIENRLVEHDHGSFNGFGPFPMARLSANAHMHGFARLVSLAVRDGFNLDLLVRIGDGNLHVADPEGRFAQIDLAGLRQRRRNARRRDQHGEEETRQEVLLNPEFDDRRAVLKRLNPLLEHTVAFDGHQRAGARVGILNQVAGGLADGKAGLLGYDVEPVVIGGIPDHAALARDPCADTRGVRSAGGIPDSGRRPVSARRFRHEGTHAGNGFGAGLAASDIDPGVDELGQVGVARTTHPCRLCVQALNVDPHVRAGNRSAAGIDHNELDRRIFVLGVGPARVLEPDQAVDGEEARAGGACDVAAAIVSHGTLHAQCPEDNVVAGALRYLESVTMAAVATDVGDDLGNCQGSSRGLTIESEGRRHRVRAAKGAAVQHRRDARLRIGIRTAGEQGRPRLGFDCRSRHKGVAVQRRGDSIRRRGEIGHQDAHGFARGVEEVCMQTEAVPADGGVVGDLEPAVEGTERR